MKKEEREKVRDIVRKVGNDSIIEEYKEYYRERDRITAKRRRGQHTNLTNNPLLRDYYFLYNNRDDDRGSDTLYKAIKGRSEYEQLLISSIYRFSSSSKLVLEIIREGGEVEEIINKISMMGKLVEGGFNYQFTFPLKENGGVKDYITKHLPSLIHGFIPKWNQYENKVLVEATRELGEVFSIRKKTKGDIVKDVNNPFVAHQVLADMSYFHPEKIDRESICYMGKGSYETMGLMGIPMHNYIDHASNTLMKLREIKDELRCSWLEWEHSSCEFNKYFLIKHGLKKGKKFTPTIEKLSA